MLLRAISLPLHGALELTAGLAVGVAPIALGFGPGAVAAAVLLGVTMVGLALAASAPGGVDALPVGAHAAYDRLLAATLLALAVGAGLAGHGAALAFFALAGLAYAALVATTRYSRAA